MEWEIYKEKVLIKEVTVENGKIKLISEKTDRGVGVRVISDGRVGFASGSDEKRVMEKALEISKISEESLSSFAFPEKIKKVKTFDKRVNQIDESDLKDFGEILAQDNVASAQFSVEIVEREISNSNGIDLRECESYISVMVEAIYDKGSAYEFQDARRLFDPEPFVERALELAKIDSKAEKLESGFYTVILSPIAIDQLLSNTLYPAFYYENIKRGRSRINEIKELSKVSLIDNPLIDFGLNSCSFDDEGVASRKTVLVEKGVVKGYLSDLKGEKSTGNGFRDGYDSYPSTAPTNIVIEFEEKGEPEGIYIHSFIGSHTSNYVSGDFSVEIMNAVHDGKGIKGAMIYGNIYEFLNKISHIGREKRQVGFTLTPEIVFENVRIL